MRSNRIWVVIPAFDAAHTLGTVIKDLRTIFPDFSIIVVDDGSRDKTALLAKQLSVDVIIHNKNRGVGAAVKTGINHALTQGGQLFVTLGADNQRDVRDIDSMIRRLKETNVDIVIGSKFLIKGQRMPVIRTFGNRTITGLFNRVFAMHFSDVTSGFRVFNERVAGDFTDLVDSYAFEVDMCARIALRRYRYAEVPVKVYYRSGTSKMHNILYVGVQMLMVMFRRRRELQW